MRSCKTIEGVSFHSSMLINPSIIKEPTSEEEARFRRAMKLLHLKPRMYDEQIMTSHPTSEHYLPEPDRLQDIEDQRRGFALREAKDFEGTRSASM